MKNKRRSCLICLLWMAGAAVAQKAAPEKSAKARFAGLHFDFHATAADTLIGNTFTAARIDSLLSLVKPDFIQVDCKGHDGFSSYPTRVGNSPGSFRKDILRIWREVTAKHDVPLFVHYSGVWDSQALRLHPEWARINADSTRDQNAVSLLGGYPKALLQPQLAELARDYRLDGAWIDGECWVLGNDYSPAVVAAFTAQTGLPDAPRKKTDKGYFEWMEFNRLLFRRYVTDYINAVHKVNPRFRITSNWAFSSMMPEKVDIPVDFLSGDVAGTNSLYSSAFESRCLALQGKPWDLMSWSFAWKNNLKATKSVVQLQQEAAEVLAMGGGFQTYWQQNRDGSPEPYHFARMAEVVKFTAARKPYCFESAIVPQVGLLYSTYAWRRVPVTGLYTPHTQEALKGNLNMLLDGQFPVEILMDHHLEERLEKYPVIVLPEWEMMDPALRRQLIRYAENGGNLVVIGAQAAASFKEILGADFRGNVRKDTTFFAGLDPRIVMLKTDVQEISPLQGTSLLGKHLLADDWRFTASQPLATIAGLGKGKVAGIYMNIGPFYLKYKNPLLPALLRAVIEGMNPPLLSEVRGSAQVHQVVSRKNGRLYVHLINTSGPHDNPNVMVYEEVPALEGISVRVNLPRRPVKVHLQPGNTPLPFTYRNGRMEIRIPRLDVHRMVEILEAGPHNNF